MDFYKEHAHEGKDAESLARASHPLRGHPLVGARPRGPARDDDGRLPLPRLRRRAARARRAPQGRPAAGLRLELGHLARRRARAPAASTTRSTAIVTSAGSGSRKPDPAIFAQALEIAGCGADEALHVGDTVAEDIAGADAAGIRALHLDRAGGGDISSLAEVVPSGEQWLNPARAGPPVPSVPDAATRLRPPEPDESAPTAHAVVAASRHGRADRLPRHLPRPRGGRRDRHLPWSSSRARRNPGRARPPGAPVHRRSDRDRREAGLRRARGERSASSASRPPTSGWSRRRWGRRSRSPSSSPLLFFTPEQDTLVEDVELRRDDDHRDRDGVPDRASPRRSPRRRSFAASSSARCAASTPFWVAAGASGPPLRRGPPGVGRLAVAGLLSFFGVILAWLYERTGSLGPPIVASHGQQLDRDHPAAL